MTRSLFGGNLEVAAALDNVDFSSGEGEMMHSVAYIRRWERGNTSQISSTSVLADTNTLTNAWQLVGEDLKTVYDESTTTSGDFQVPIGLFNDSRLNSISSIVPVIYNPSTFFSIPEIEQFQSTLTEQSQSIGTYKSANPQASSRRFFSTRAQRLPPSTKYSGIAGTSRDTLFGGSVGQVTGSIPIDLVTDGMWQFLFNPSELELSAGPEYRTAETWATTGNANSGQPVHWSHNKNPTLKFSSVILNGYVFGKRVEELEQGLFGLFMARDGAGQDSPFILEFVWGKKAFGPCVIKDIVVKEKAWDDGLLVNAEVSFTLEKIPEWVINDGFVDIARPGAQPVTDVTLSRDVGGETNSDDAEITEQETPPASTGPTNNQNSGTPPRTSRNKCASYDAAACERIRDIRVNLLNLASKILGVRDTTRSDPRFSYGIFAPKFTQQGLNSYYTQYVRLYDSAKASLGTCFTPRVIKNYRPVTFKNEYLDNEKRTLKQKYDALANASINSARALRELLDASRCKSKGVSY